MIGPSTMNQRIAVAAVTAAIVATVTASLVLASPASAQDQRHCVSKVEWLSLTGFLEHNEQPNNAATKSAIEAHWEVSGMGRRNGTLTIYPRCGYDRSEAWYGIQVFDPELVAAWGWVAFDATPHGHK